MTAIERQCISRVMLKDPDTCNCNLSNHCPQKHYTEIGRSEDGVFPHLTYLVLLHQRKNTETHKSHFLA